LPLVLQEKKRKTAPDLLRKKNSKKKKKKGNFRQRGAHCLNKGGRSVMFLSKGGKKGEERGRIAVEPPEKKILV